MIQHPVIALTVIVPTQILFEQPLRKVIAEAENGSFCLLPNHIDLLTTLRPGILICETLDGAEKYIAVNEGILVKCGASVRVSTRHGVLGDDLNRLRQRTEEQFQAIDEQERRSRLALAQLEANLASHFMQLQEQR